MRFLSILVCTDKPLSVGSQVRDAMVKVANNITFGKSSHMLWSNQGDILPPVHFGLLNYSF